MAVSVQTSIRGVLVIVALCAIAISPVTFVTWLLIELLLVFLFVRLLIGNLPFAIRKAQMHNCVRADGTWSDRREAIEDRELSRLYNNMFGACLLLLIPTHALIWYVDSEVIPISIGFDALMSWAGNETDWKANLDDEQREMGRWWKRRSLSAESLEDHKQFLWDYWPAILTGFAIWMAIGFTYLWKTYYQSLKELEHSIFDRAQQYRLCDFARFEQPASVRLRDQLGTP